MTTGAGPQADAASGRLVGNRYQLIERLGTGGMGTVWRGRDVLVEREVAVKEANVAGRPGQVERILREARAAARVNHPAAVTVHDIVIEDGHPWIVMELVHGESLAELLRRKSPLPETEAARIALSVAEALAAAHDRGVLHRDVKPANVLLGPAGRVVLTDFGIAHIEGEEPLTRTGEFVGSLAFTAPERMEGHRPGSAADLWSLGVLIFVMVEGYSPFQRDSVPATVSAVLDDDPRLSRVAQLAGLVEKLLAKDPGDRPPVERAVAVLGAVAGGRPDRVPVAGVAEAAVTEAPAEVAVTEAPAEAATTVAPAEVVMAEEPGRAGTPEATGVPRGRGGAAGETRAPRAPGRMRPWSVVVLTVVLLGALAWGITRLTGDGDEEPGPAAQPTSSATRSTAPEDTAGHTRVQESEFSLEVPAGWKRHSRNAEGQYRYTAGEFELIVGPGRDAGGAGAAGLIDYQGKTEPELAPFRESEWASISGLGRTEVDGHQAARGAYSWTTEDGRNIYAENLVVLVVGDRYDIVQLRGPEGNREDITRLHAQAVASYTPR
ncbi:protein kinase [Streptomyces sp. NBC_00247]|uniref:serine/threonine-protein kinase n=1 Tax=Streptomyces sp. NBC_00247 TaxID=2975689 RepID=UPI002E280E64|nr:protein kinase [Streptomyces sp. NBC_00247]